MKRALLHIGFPKTGTTSIQKFCFAHRRPLRQAGIDYPQLHLLARNGRPKVSHDALTVALMLRPPPRLVPQQALGAALVPEKLARFRRSRQDMLLISDETLSQRVDLDFPRLNGWLEGLDLTVLAFVRVFDDWLESLYGQNVRAGIEVIKPFRQFRLGQPERMAFLPRLRQFREHLAPAGFILLSYDRFRNEGLVPALLRYAGTSDPALLTAAADSKAVNLSRSALEVLFGAYLSWATGDAGMTLAGLAAFAAARKAGVPLPFADRRYGFIPPDLRQQARALYRRDLPVLAREFGLEADDPGPVTDEQLDYRTTLTRDEFETLLAIARPHLPPSTPPIPADAFQRAAQAFAA